MTQSEIKIAVILTAYDRMSKTVGSAISKTQGQLTQFSKKANSLAQNSFNSGKQLAAAGLAVGYPLQKMIEKYAELEDSQLALKSTMMDANGKVLPVFDKVSKYAIELGNLLPGTTRDFNEMFNIMLTNGSDANDILKGTGKSAAYLAVQLKIPYAEAGEMAVRLKTATGTANEDMIEFMDTLTRIKTVGPSVQEMQMAFQRSAGALKANKLQGLEATKQVGSLYAILTKVFGSGEKVGTGFASLLAAFSDPKVMGKAQAAANKLGISLQFKDAKTGDFLGIPNMLKQFEKLKGLTTKGRDSIVNTLFGAKGADQQIANTLISEGLDGYNRINEKIKNQADLNTKVNSQLGSLKNMWDAVSGTMENTAASIGQLLAPSLKNIFSVLNNKILPALNKFIDKHPTLIKYIGYAAASFAAMALAGAALSFVIGGVAKFMSLAAGAANFLLNPIRLLTSGKMGLFRMVIKLKNGFLQWKGVVIGVFNAVRDAAMANPVTAIIIAIAAAAYLIYSNWSTIKTFFIGVWNKIKGVVMPILNVLKTAFLNFIPIGWVIKLWSPISKLVGAIFGLLKAIVGAAFRVFKFMFMNFTPIGVVIKHWGKIAPYIKGVFNWIKSILMSVFNFFNGILAKIFNTIMGVGKSFFKAGANIINSIINGITSKITWLTDKIKGITKKIRNFFPFSPAKEGPLKDIHKVRLIETIAQSIKPSSLVNAVRKTAGFAMNVFSKPLSPVFGHSQASATAPVSFNLTVNLSGSATKSDASLLGNEMKKQFDIWMKQYKAQNSRVAF